MHDRTELVDMILMDDLDAVRDVILLENEETQIARQIGDTTVLNYLIKLEEYLDDHDVYLFNGWEDAELVQKPVIEKFWTTFIFRVGQDCDLRGAKRITNDKEAQNEVKIAKTEDGAVLVQMRILKRYLDAIEARNKDKSDELSSQELERMQ